MAEPRRSNSACRKRFRPISFEQLVFSKPYFDCAGLILAFDDGRPVGFAHAGFGPNENDSGISTDLGTTCLMMLEPGCSEAEVSAGLLERSEDYLRGRGAKVLYGGGMSPLNPFYLGLYGGSELPGVLGQRHNRAAAFDEPPLPGNRAHANHAHAI